MSGRKRSRSPLHLDENDEDFDFDDDCSINSKNPPIQRNAANARERARMRVLSSAFCRLKTKLPWVPADTKLSKLDTLRLATIYIQQLRSCLAKDDAMYSENYSHVDGQPTVDENQSNQFSLVWPFTFSQSASDNPSHRISANINQWITRDSTLQDFRSNSSTIMQTNPNMHTDPGHPMRNRIFNNANSKHILS